MMFLLKEKWFQDMLKQMNVATVRKNLIIIGMKDSISLNAKLDYN